jgi:uncharacterized RDD family membrane protein YckC
VERDDLIYAGFWIRVWASVIDSVLVLMVITPLLWFVYGSITGSGWLGFRDPLDFVVQVVFPAVGCVAFWVYRSATPGKMAIGAEIVDARTGGRPTTAQLIGRYVGYYVSLIPLGLGFLWIAFDPRKQGWHDKLAGTVVVRRREVVRFDEGR